MIGGHNRVAPLVAELTAAGIRASLFIDPDRDQIAAAHRVGRTGDRASHRRLLHRGRGTGRRAPASFCGP